MCVCSLIHVWLFATQWTITHQAPLSMVSSQQEYCSGLPFPFQGVKVLRIYKFTQGKYKDKKRDGDRTLKITYI